MKKIFLFLACIFAAYNAVAQSALMLKHANGVVDMIPRQAVDSLTLSDDLAHLVVVSGEKRLSVPVNELRGFYYDELVDKAIVSYDDDKVSVINPFFLDGVSVAVDGANVIINNEDIATERIFTLMGTTANGSFTYYGAYKTTIELNGVSITNPAGAAVDIQCGKRIALNLVKGTENFLVDGAGEQKAALYCKGHLEIDKSGNLTVTGNTKHAISSKEYCQIKNGVGTIHILGAKGDGIHAGEYFQQNGGNIILENIADDGIQAEAKLEEGVELDGQMLIKGGSITMTTSVSDIACLKADDLITISDEKSMPVINLNLSGAASKGISTDGSVNILAGQISITNSGTGLTEASETYTAKGITADQDVNILGGELTITMTGDGGKCIKADGNLVVGSVQDPTANTTPAPVLNLSTKGGTYGSSSSSGGGGGGGRPGGGGGRPGQSSDGSSPKAVKVMGTATVNSGNMTIHTEKSGGEGLEGKQGVTINGGQHYFDCYDDCINSGGIILFEGGITVCKSSGNDAVDSNYGRAGAITIGNGTIFTYTTAGGPEMGIDCDNNSYIRITGNGTLIAAGGTQGGGSTATITNPAQGYAFVTTTISYQPGRYYTLADANGNNLVTYSFDKAVSSSTSMFTAAGMVKGSSYNVKYSTTEPTDAQVAFHGLYLGSSAKGTNSVTTFTAK